jgi:hypothetical protein
MSSPVRLTDTTLRDGSHAVKHQFTIQQVRDIVAVLDLAGIDVIEVTHGDGLSGSTFNYGFSGTDERTLIQTAVQSATRARIAVLLLPGLGTVTDLRAARDLGASVARVATHCTEADVSIQHFGAARDLGMETVGFLMLSHRTSPEGLAKQARIMADAAAEEVAKPIIARLPVADRSSIIQGKDGVYNSFLFHAEAAARRYGVPAHEILARVGQAGYVGGQEDMIIDVALTIAAERGKLALAEPALSGTP